MKKALIALSIVGLLVVVFLVGITGAPEETTSEDSPITPVKCGNGICEYHGFVYGFGIGTGVHWRSKKVYLSRVPKASIAAYGKYEYFAGMNGKKPTWSKKQADAKPVRGIEAYLQASAMFHPGTKRYLFLTALPDGGLFEAPKPWGPWTKVASLFLSGKNPAWKLTGYIPGVISKGAGPRHFYFTIAGEIENYQLYVGKIELGL